MIVQHVLFLLYQVVATYVYYIQKLELDEWITRVMFNLFKSWNYLNG